MIRVLFICHGISIHALFAEGDRGRTASRCPHPHFYPRPLRRGRRVSTVSDASARNISIHALFAEGDLKSSKRKLLPPISIHALFAEGDAVPDFSYTAYPSISIHALFAEGDQARR